MKFLLRHDMSDQPLEPEQGRGSLQLTALQEVPKGCHTVRGHEGTTRPAGLSPCTRLGLQEPEWC